MTTKVWIELIGIGGNGQHSATDTGTTRIRAISRNTQILRITVINMMTTMLSWLFAVTVIVVADRGFSTAAAQVPQTQLDVNDVSYLWPVPKTKDDVARLISADTMLADGSSAIWPKQVFDGIISKAQAVVIKDAAGRDHKIDFATHAAQLSAPSTWKLVAFRADASAPGASKTITDAFGLTPQLRLIFQPVTIDEMSGAISIHDTATHLIFSYVNRLDPALPGIGVPRGVPDRDAFGAIVTDLLSLKNDLIAASVATSGKLAVHPGLSSNATGFADKVKLFLTKRLRADRISGAAFMGVEADGQPWIFIAMTRQSRGLDTFALPVLGGTSAQMLSLSKGGVVVPEPKTRNVDATKGVSTSLLFDAGVRSKLESAIFAGNARPSLKDIPDIIANPQLSNFFNTDCVSCHSESTRRNILHINVSDNQFRYALPAKISGVDDSALPSDKWNVRNFGWGLGSIPTVSLRTANESAEAADYINREYLTTK